MGPNRAQKCRRFLGFFPNFSGILMPSWGFNYSEMANYRFLIDPNTFLTISGTSKILSKSGPVTLPITVNLLQKIQENIWKHPWKIWIWEI